MTSNVNPPTLDALLVHARFLRSLAQQLVGPDMDPDDVVQETWQRAITNPPKTAENLSGWLGTTCRRIVHQRRRQEVNARKRMKEASRPGELASENHQRKETFRMLADAVLALPEPHCATMIWRTLKSWPAPLE